MRTLKNKVELEDTRLEKDMVTEQTKINAEEIRSQFLLTNLIYDAIR